MIAIKKKFDNIDDGIANMIAAANYDYNNWGRTAASEEMKKKFANDWVIKEGKKYIKIISGNSAWGFIVNTDDDKLFKRGDLLKCAGWAAPARNKARGNVLEGGFGIEWTGPRYL